MVEFSTLHLNGCYLLGRQLFLRARVLSGISQLWALMVYLEWQAEPWAGRGGKDFQHRRYSKNLKPSWRAGEHELGEAPSTLERCAWVFAARNLLWAWLSLLASVFLAPPNSFHFTSPHSQDHSAAANVAVWTSLLFENSEAQHWERESSLLCSLGPVGDHCGAEPRLVREHPGGCHSFCRAPRSEAPSAVLEILVQDSETEF